MLEPSKDPGSSAGAPHVRSTLIGTLLLSLCTPSAMATMEVRIQILHADCLVIVFVYKREFYYISLTIELIRLSCLMEQFCYVTCNELLRLVSQALQPVIKLDQLTFLLRRRLRDHLWLSSSHSWRRGEVQRGTDAHGSQFRAFANFFGQPTWLECKELSAVLAEWSRKLDVVKRSCKVSSML